MKKLNNLVNSFKSSVKVQRYLELEKIVNLKYKDDYEKILFLQREAVRKNDFTLYNNRLDEFKSNIIISEYLDLIEEINADIMLIKNIIEEGINADILT